MLRSAVERYAVGAMAFVAAATWLGVGVTHGLLCLVVAFVGTQGVRAYQRRTGKRASVRRRNRAPQRHRGARLAPSDRYDDEDFDWPAVRDTVR
jgi:hypothetical protein